MSCNIASKKDIPVVKLELDVNLETSTLEDLTPLNKKFDYYRALSLNFCTNGTKIKGELWFRQELGEYKDDLQYGVTLYNVEAFSAFFDLDFKNQENDRRHKVENENSHNEKDLSRLSKTSTNQKLPLNTKCSYCKGKIMFGSNIGSNIKVNGKITLKIELAIETENDSIKMKNFKDFLCETAFVRFDEEKNFTIICEGEQFGFNKTLLCMISEVFASMIQLPNGQEKLTNSVEIKDFSSDTIRAFQKIVFGEEEDISNELFSPELLLFAQKYFIKPLAEKCKKHLLETLSNENIYEIIRVAYLTDNEEILKMAATYAKENLAELKTSGEWLAFRKSNPDCMFKVYDYMY